MFLNQVTIAASMAAFQVTGKAVEACVVSLQDLDEFFVCVQVIKVWRQWQQSWSG